MYYQKLPHIDSLSIHSTKKLLCNILTNSTKKCAQRRRQRQHTSTDTYYNFTKHNTGITANIKLVAPPYHFMRETDEHFEHCLPSSNQPTNPPCLFPNSKKHTKTMHACTQLSSHTLCLLLTSLHSHLHFHPSNQLYFFFLLCSLFF